MATKPADEGPLVSTAKAIGKAAGKVAALAGAAPTQHPEGERRKSTSQNAGNGHAAKGKLQKKNKPHLPRKMKKAQKKLRAASDAD